MEKPVEAVVVHQAQPMEPARDVTAQTVVGMIETVIAKGVTAENAMALEKLVTLCERMQDRQAQQQFAAAFVALQAEMPRIQAKKPVPNNDGTIRYKFAPYEEIMEQVSPMLNKHGFTVSFTTKFLEGRICVVCKLTHTGGHSEENEFAVRIGKGPPGATETQSDGAAKTYAKRGALCDCLNIVIEHDSDARAEGDTITEEQAADLQTRVTSLGMSEASFLKLGQAAKYTEIRTAVYPVLIEVLRRKEGRR